MRIPLLCCAVLAGCVTTAQLPAVTPGVSGPALAGTLGVHVVDEAHGFAAVAGASVDVGGAAVRTDAHGDATITTSASSVTLTVHAAGFETERWIGVDRASVIVGLATPLVAYTIDGAISGLSTDALVSGTSALSILRTSSPRGSTAPCMRGGCNTSLTVEGRAPRADVDVVIVDATSARLASGVMVDAASGRFAIDVSTIGVGERLVTLTLTSLPAGAGLTSVVGVPGLATLRGVALLPALTTTAMSVVAPAREGVMAGDRLWYVARATSTDGFGESMAFDREVGADGVVHLPTTFLAVPRATASGTVSITVDPAVGLYVVEAFAGATATRALVLHPSGTQIDVPVDLTGASGVVVRAIDTPPSASGEIDLAAIEARTTRIATLQL